MLIFHINKTTFADALVSMDGVNQLLGVSSMDY
jgi:hypothetical protein